MRNELAQIFAVINQSRSTETDGGSCVYLAQPKIRSGTFLAATLGRLSLLGRGNLAMHMASPSRTEESAALPYAPVPCGSAPGSLPWFRMKPASCGEQEVLELCLKVWSFPQHVSCLELCQDRPGQPRSSAEHTPAPGEQVVAAGRVPPCRCVSAGIWEVEVSPLGLLAAPHPGEKIFSWLLENQVNMVPSKLG